VLAVRNQSPWRERVKALTVYMPMQVGNGCFRNTQYKYYYIISTHMGTGLEYIISISRYDELISWFCSSVFHDLRHRHQVKIGKLFVGQRNRMQAQRETVASDHLRYGTVCDGPFQRCWFLDSIGLVAGITIYYN